MNNLPKIISIALQNLISEEREKRSLSQKEFAIKCGFSRQYIGMLESGKRIPKLDSFLQLSMGFDMSLADFIFALQERIDAASMKYNKKHVISKAADSKNPKWA